MLGVFNLVNDGAAVLVLALALAPVVVNIIVCCNGIKLVFSNSSVSKDGYNGIDMSFGQPQMSNQKDKEMKEALAYRFLIYYHHHHLSSSTIPLI